MSLDRGRGNHQVRIYNSRNYGMSLDDEHIVCEQGIYNSRNYGMSLDAAGVGAGKAIIYNSRNYGMSLDTQTLLAGIFTSTTVEITACL